mgnify:CR=1 FL=1
MNFDLFLFNVCETEILFAKSGFWGPLKKLQQGFEAGFEKLHGSNWFADIQDQFPWPFKLIPADLNWALATSFEIVGAIALVIGLGTRFFSASLIVLTLVAMLSVHWPESWSTLSELLKGYALTNDGFGNFKLPVIYIAMLLPLVFMGPGRLSMDALIHRRVEKSSH